MKLEVNIATFGLSIILLINQLYAKQADNKTDPFLRELGIKNVAQLPYFIPTKDRILGPVLGIMTSVIADVYIHETKEKFSGPHYLDVPNFHNSIYQLEEFVFAETKRVTEELDYALKEQLLINPFRRSLDLLSRCLDNNCEKCLIYDKCPKHIKQIVIDELTTVGSDYRNELSKIISSNFRPAAQQIQDVFAPDLIFGSIVKKMLNKASTSNLNCDDTKSQQMKIYDISMYVMNVIAKSYAAVLIAYGTKYNIPYTNETAKAVELSHVVDFMDQFPNAINSIVHETQCAFKTTSNFIRRCDPIENVRGKTYERLTKFIQAQFYNELKLTDNYETEEPLLPPRFISDSYNTINGSRPEINTIYYDPNDNERTYHHLTLEKKDYLRLWSKERIVEKIYGQVGSKVLLHNIAWDSSKPGVSFGFADHKFSPYSVRRISLYQNNATDGYVVTGMRFAFRNKILCIDIQEGMLDADYNNVNKSTVRWKNMTANYDETVIMDVNTRTVNLDDLLTSEHRYVTGAAFEVRDGVIHLSMRELDMIYIVNNSKSSPADHVWTKSDSRKARSELVLTNSKPSELLPSNQKNLILSVSGENYVKFQPTGLNEDAAQTTIPYIDIQEVITFPAAPLGGIGLFYKGFPGYGGYIALKLISPDATSKLKRNQVSSFTEKAEEIRNFLFKETNYKGILKKY